MESKSLLISLIALLLLACPVLAEPKYKVLQTDAKKLQRTLRDSETSRTAAAKRVAANVKDQKSASGEKLKSLKRIGVSLAKSERTSAEAAKKAQSDLIEKQGEVRAAAAKFASSEISNKDNKLFERIRGVIAAMDAWDEAIGSLPKVPKPRDTSGITEPEVKQAIVADDKKALEDFKKWADAEVDRLKAELSQMAKLLKHEVTVKNQDDGPKMVTESRALKKKLSTRKSDVRKLKNTAESRLKALR
ncbi:MAG: hypothetical protein L3J82_04595 [Planctomycetes bacterium]|nr:hypothetical protein [Planctomycetota bacterium]